MYVDCRTALITTYTLLIGTEDLARRYENARPAATKASYGSKQQEFKAFCSEMYPSLEYASAVNTEKIVYFLTKAVIGRKTRKAGRKKSDEADHEEKIEPSAKMIGMSTVKAYVSALVDLYNQQKQANINNYPHPRTGPSGHQIKRLLHTLQLENNELKRNNYVDRGIGTLQDGYCTAVELGNIGDQLMRQHPGKHLHWVPWFLSNNRTRECWSSQQTCSAVVQSYGTPRRISAFT